MAEYARHDSIASSAMRTASERCLATSEFSRSVDCSPTMAIMPKAITAIATMASTSETPRCAARPARCHLERARPAHGKSLQLPGTRTIEPVASCSAFRMTASVLDAVGAAADAIGDKVALGHGGALDA